MLFLFLDCFSFWLLSFYDTRSNDTIVLFSSFFLYSLVAVYAALSVYLGGVNTCDQMVKNKTVKRKTNRWPLAVFYRILDFAALNAFVIWQSLHPDDKSTRHEFLQQLSAELARPHMVTRSTVPRLQLPIKRALQECGIELPAGGGRGAGAGDVADIAPRAKKRRCYVCPSSKDRKVKQACSKCNRAICKQHSSAEVVIMCDNCKDN